MANNITFYDFIIIFFFILIVFISGDIKSKIKRFLFIVLLFHAFFWRLQFVFIDVTDNFSNIILLTPEIILVLLLVYILLFKSKAPDSLPITKYFYQY